MAASLIHQGDQVVTIQIEVQLTDSMLESEERIQDALNEGGNLATQKALEQFDADGSPIQIGSTRLTSKGQEPKVYQTPYGEIEVSRHVYQTSQGGKTFCPLEQNARILITSTPRFAKQVSHKYAEMSSPRVIEDLAMNHHRRVTRCFVQDLAELVGSVAQAKEEDWSYETPRLTERVSTITIGLDGTTVLFCQGGYREAMVGTIGLYDREGERLHTIYLGNSPEYGKETFLARLEREIERIRKSGPTR